MVAWMVEKKAQLMADVKVSLLDIELVEKWVVWKAEVMAESTAVMKGDESAAKRAALMVETMA